MTFIDQWDSGLPGANWDTGLEWDLTVGNPTGDVTPYLDLVTSEYRNKPNLLSVLTTLLQPIVGTTALIESMPAAYDLDNAIGAQLDTTGKWIGAARDLKTPITGVYFALDTPGVGFDEGTWQSRFQPSDEFIQLADPQFKTLLRARIANNQWDGTVPGAYEAWDTVFAGTGFGVLIQDLANMHILFALTGNIPDAVTLALFTGGYLNVKPAGVMIDTFMTPTVANAPYFGFDSEGSEVAGFDTGAWGKATSRS